VGRADAGLFLRGGRKASFFIVYPDEETFVLVGRKREPQDHRGKTDRGTLGGEREEREGLPIILTFSPDGGLCSLKVKSPPKGRRLFWDANHPTSWPRRRAALSPPTHKGDKLGKKASLDRTSEGGEGSFPVIPAGPVLSTLLEEKGKIRRQAMATSLPPKETSFLVVDGRGNTFRSRGRGKTFKPSPGGKAAASTSNLPCGKKKKLKGRLTPFCWKEKREGGSYFGSRLVQRSLWGGDGRLSSRGGRGSEKGIEPRTREEGFIETLRLKRAEGRCEKGPNLASEIRRKFSPRGALIPEEKERMVGKNPY